MTSGPGGGQAWGPERILWDPQMAISLIRAFGGNVRMRSRMAQARGSRRIQTVRWFLADKAGVIEYSIEYMRVRHVAMRQFFGSRLIHTFGKKSVNGENADREGRKSQM